MGLFFWRKTAPALSGRVVVFGATTAVGRTLALLLKLNPLVREVVCCDAAPAAGGPSARAVAADLGYIDTDATTAYVSDPAQWPAAVRGAQLALVCCGAAVDTLRADRDVALPAVAPAVLAAVRAVAAAAGGGAPAPVTAVVSSPLNALVPLCAEELRRAGAFDPRKLLGVTTLDVARTRRLVAEALGKNPYDVNIPVVGGRGGVTACPLIAQTGLRVPPEVIVRITGDVQQYGSAFAPDEGVGDGTAVTAETAPAVALGMAYAAHEFCVSVLKAQRGDVGISECALVESTMRPETPFFSSRVLLGREGVEKIHPMGAITAYEHEIIEAAVPALAADVAAGLAYAKASQPS